MDHHRFLKASLSQSPVVVLCTNLKRNVAILTERQFSTLKVLDFFYVFILLFFILAHNTNGQQIKELSSKNNFILQNVNRERKTGIRCAKRRFSLLKICFV